MFHVKLQFDLCIIGDIPSFKYPVSSFKYLVIPFTGGLDECDYVVRERLPADTKMNSVASFCPADHSRA